MAKLDEELVAAFIVEKFKVTQAEAWEFVDSVKQRAKEEVLEKEPSGERKKKEYVVVVYDPEKKLNLDNYSAFVVEKLPTTVLENGSTIPDSTSDREWGDLELTNLLEVSIKEAKRKYSKKGPYNSLADIVQYAPAKLLKSAGLKFISKNPSSIITFSSDNLKNEEDDMLELSNTSMFIQ